MTKDKGGGKDPLDKVAKPNQLRAMRAEGLLSPTAADRALELSGAFPEEEDWKRFFQHLTLFGGVAFLLVGIVFFFAFNWARMDRFLKFALVEGCILISVLLAVFLGVNKLSGKVSLLAAAVLVGPLLVVYSQVYQTGADPYHLFWGWALLISGWVVLGFFSALWILLLVLLEISLYLYWSQIWGITDHGVNGWMYLAFFTLNGGAFFTWEYLAEKGVKWLKNKWIQNGLYVATVISLFFPAVTFLFYTRPPSIVLTAFLYFLIVPFFIWHYYRREFNKNRLLLALVSLIGLYGAWLVKGIGDRWGSLFFLLFIAVTAGVYALWEWRLFSQEKKNDERKEILAFSLEITALVSGAIPTMAMIISDTFRRNHTGLIPLFFIFLAVGSLKHYHSRRFDFQNLVAPLFFLVVVGNTYIVKLIPGRWWEDKAFFFVGLSAFFMAQTIGCVAWLKKLYDRDQREGLQNEPE